MTEILKCPLLPDVGPRVRGSPVCCWVSAESDDPNMPVVTGAIYGSPEDAITLWNAWMQPLHDLQAENERQAARIAELEAALDFASNILRETT